MSKRRTPGRDYERSQKTEKVVIISVVLAVGVALVLYLVKVTN
jgi:hypothetical protein